MPSINEVRIMGHLGNDQETKFTQSGIPVTNLSVATTRSYKASPDAKEWTQVTTWHRVVAWRVPEKMLEYLRKGNLVLVKGRLETRSYEKDGETRWVTEIIADQGGVMFLREPYRGGPKDEDAPPEREQPPIDMADVPF